MHILFVAACILGAWQCRRSAFQAAEPHQGFVKEILIRAAWPPALVLCTTIVVHYWTPISHAISPPAMRTRESLLVRDQDTKVAYPTEEEEYRAGAGLAALCIVNDGVIFVSVSGVLALMI